MNPVGDTLDITAAEADEAKIKTSAMARKPTSERRLP
jgi:hypothetical protein